MMSDRPLFIRLTLPSGLEEVLEGLAKEVLRHRPSDIYEFSAQHFEDLLKKRDGLSTSNYDDFGTKGSILSDIENALTPDNEETPDITIEPLENPFEEPSDECDIEINDVVTRRKSIDIQLPIRIIGVNNNSVTDVHDFSPNEDSPTNGSTLGETRDNLSDVERPKTPIPENNHIYPMENAATQIQSGCKGMSSRGEKVIDSENKTGEVTIESMKFTENFENEKNYNQNCISDRNNDVNCAASLIQAVWKGYMTRQNFMKKYNDKINFERPDHIESEVITIIGSELRNNIDKYEFPIMSIPTEGPQNEEFEQNEPHKIKVDLTNIMSLSHSENNQDFIQEESRTPVKNQSIGHPNQSLASSDIDEIHDNISGTNDLHSDFLSMKPTEKLTNFNNDVDYNEFNLLSTVESHSSEEKRNSYSPNFRLNEPVDNYSAIISKEDLRDFQRIGEEEKSISVSSKKNSNLNDYADVKESNEFESNNKDDKLSEEFISSVLQERSNQPEKKDYINLHDLEIKATIIQAYFKGYKTRTDLLNKKNIYLQNKRLEYDENNENKNAEDTNEEETLIQKERNEQLKCDPTLEEKSKDDEKVNAIFYYSNKSKELNDYCSEAEGKSDQNDINQLQANRCEFDTNKEIPPKTEDNSCNESAAEILSGSQDEMVSEIERKTEDSFNKATTEIQSGFHKLIQKNCKDGEESVPDDLNEAATKLQANYRGFKTRKDLEFNNIENETTADNQSKFHELNDKNLEDEEESDLDELNAAATKLQANYRGFKTRKELKAQDNSLNEAATEIQSGFRELNQKHSNYQRESFPDELNDAATHLQASYRGFKTREALAVKTEQDLLSQIPTETKVTFHDKNEMVSEDEGGNLSDDLNEAATKLQANYRGFKTRKELAVKTEQDLLSQVPTETNVTFYDKNEMVPKDGEEGDLVELNDAATKLQANYRGFKTRKELKNQNESLNDAATEIQSGFLALKQKHSNYQRESFPDDLNSAATQLQASYRGFKTREALAVKTEQDLLSQIPTETKVTFHDKNEMVSEDGGGNLSDNLNIAATQLQASYRGFKTRKALAVKTEQDLLSPAPTEIKLIISDQDQTISEDGGENLSDDINEAATKLQANYRGFKTRKELKTQNESLNEAATEIQSGFHELNQKNSNHQRESFLDELNDAATQLQANYRGFKTRKELVVKTEHDLLSQVPTETKVTFHGKDQMVPKNREESDSEELNAVATKLQANYRGFKTRKELKIQNESLNGAATEIQSGFRELNQKHSNNHGESFPDDLNAAATQLQANYRGFKTREELTVKTEQDLLSQVPAETNVTFHDKNEMVPKDGEEGDLVELNDAATKLQANYRGFKTREELTVKTEQDLLSQVSAETNVTFHDKNEMVPENINKTDSDELNDAATKLQANYRGFKTRKELKAHDNSLNEAATEIQSGFRELNQKHSNYQRESFPDDLNSAATQLQASYRGFKTREELTVKTEQDLLSLVPAETNVTFHDKNEMVPEDINKSDSDELNAAATQLQASYRGFKTRKEFGVKTEQDLLSQVPTETQLIINDKNQTISEDLGGNLSDDLNEAATKLQANYRGFKTRKELAVKTEQDLLSQVPTETQLIISDQDQTISEDGGENLSDDLNAAATKLQANYRGFKTRKELKAQDNSLNEAATEIQSRFRELNQKHSNYQRESFPDELNDAATQLQASYRGFKTREALAVKTEQDLLSQIPTETKVTFHDKNEMVSEDGGGNLSDDLNASATKLQANYRGFKTRKELQAQDNSLNEAATEIQSRFRELNQKHSNYNYHEESFPDNLNVAATQLQASYRGFKTRKELSAKLDPKLLCEATLKSHLLCQDKDKINSNDKSGYFADEFNDNATKQQKNYHGSRTRKQLSAKAKFDLLCQAPTETKSIIIDEDETISEDDGSNISNDLNEAATKLQANYRGFKTRKELKIQDNSLNEAATEIQSGFRELNQKNSNHQGESFSDDLNIAATQLQASYRGFKTRKALAVKTEQDLLSPAPTEIKLIISDQDQTISEDGGENLSDDLNAAATKLQANYRGFKTRKELKAQDNSLNEAATEIQSGFRELNQKNSNRQRESFPDDLNAAATQLQANYRGFKTRKALAVKTEQDLLSQIPTETKVTFHNKNEMVPEDGGGNLSDDLNASATKLQANYRGFKTRKELKAQDNSLNEAATEIQSGFRELNQKHSNYQRESFPDELNDAATQLQASYRGFKTREALAVKTEQDLLSQIPTETKVTFHDKNEMVSEDGGGNLSDDLNEAATQLQASYRGFKTREELTVKTEQDLLSQVPAETNVTFHDKNEMVPKDGEEGDLVELNDAATKLQANYRGFKTRKELKNQNESLNEAATEIQSGFRELNQKHSNYQRESFPDDLNEAATKLQANYRGFKTRKELAVKTEQDLLSQDPTETQLIINDKNQTISEDLGGNLSDDLNEAATKLQANYRGFKTRKDLTATIDQESLDNIATKTKLTFTNDEEVISPNYQPENHQVALPTQDKVDQHMDEIFMHPKETFIPNDINNQKKLSHGFPQNADQIYAATIIQARFRGYLIRKKQYFGFGSKQLFIEQDLLKKNNAASIIQAYFKSKQIQEKYKKKSFFSLKTKGSTDNYDSVIINKQNANKVLFVEDKSDSVKDAEFVVDSSNFEYEDTRNKEYHFESKSNPNIKPPVDRIDFMNNIHDERQTLEKDAAIKIQSYFRGFKERKRFKRRDTFILQDSDHPLEESHFITDIGAIPFSSTKSIPQIDDVDNNFNAMNSVDGKLNPYRIRIFHYRESTESEKVLMYLYERGIEFSGYHMDLAENENYGDWFLKLNAKGEIPTMVFNETNIVSTAYNIIEFLESNIPVNSHPPPLIPCNTDPVLYPKYQEFIRKIGKIPLSIVSDGIAFHPEVSVLKPYNEPHFSKIRNDVRHLSTLLMEYANSVDDPSVQNALKSKAESHKTILPRYTQVEEYKALLHSISLIFDDIEKKFSLEPWVLGRKFSVADICLGVLMNRIILLGNPKQILSNRKKLPQFFKALKHRRPAFRKSVHRIAEDKLCAAVFHGRSGKGKKKSENVVTWSSFWK